MLIMRDGLKPLNELLNADERNLHFVRRNLSTNEIKPNSIEAHYADIETYTVHASVPNNIATQYDVARNIYSYAWFEYRFFNVAEASVLTVLELALKERIGEENIIAYIKQHKGDICPETGKKINRQKGLKTYMEYCRDNQLVFNNAFSAWHRYPTQLARIMAEQAQFSWATAEMEGTGKTEIELPDIVIEKLPPDENYDHIQHLINYVNKLRNGYAHGNTNLYADVLKTFEMVSEFINQLYPAQKSMNTHRLTINKECPKDETNS